MKSQELKELQANFEMNEVCKKEEIRATQLRKRFVKDFPRTRLCDLDLDTYVVGKGRKDTFCYRIENELNLLGNIHGATASKFGVYFGKKGAETLKDYQRTKKFGSDVEEAFANVKREILDLLIAGQNEDYESIKASKISDLFRGKLLYVYYPDKYLNIFSEKHLSFFLNALSVDYYEDMQKSLLDFKNDDLVMGKWSIFRFTQFLYHSFGRPGREKKLSSELKDFVQESYPNLNEVIPEFISSDVSDEVCDEESVKNPSKGKTNFEVRDRRNRKLGERGELIVLRAERNKLTQLGKEILSAKVERVSVIDDSLGYDLLSFEENGKSRYIEVKTTRHNVGQFSFFISANELKKAKELDNYYIYVVFNADKTNPKILPIKSPFRENNFKLIPITYKVNLVSEMNN